MDYKKFQDIVIQIIFINWTKMILKGVIYRISIYKGAIQAS